MEVCGEDTVTLVRRDVAGTDRYGNDVLIDSETVVPYCSMQPMWGQESTAAADQAIDRFRLYLPGLALTDLDIDPSMIDAIRFHGLLYEINGWGQPWRWAGVVDHVVFYLRRATG